MVDARKKEIESAEHDPENFPEVPASEQAPAAAPVVAAESAPAVATEPEAEAEAPVVEPPAAVAEGTSETTAPAAS